MKQDKLRIPETVTMLYYADLAPPRHFYGKILGLNKRLEYDWVTLYEITAGSLVGVVQPGPNAFHQVQEKNAVMLSIVTEDVDAWYAKIKAHPEIGILRDIHDSTTAPVRGFIVADPGGYTVEFFQWRATD